MGKTILELFKGSPQDTSVKPETETFVEQELSGIRIRSAVDINNPLIYGNEAIRITQRSTPLLEKMKGNTGGDGDGGLIGGKIAAARDFINSTIGIPETQTPSRLLDNKNIQISAANKAFPGIGSSLPNKTPKSFEDIPSNIPITKDIISKNGTGLGQLLKSTGGGNPKTLGRQALGKGIGLAKDKLRGALFGQGQSIGDAIGDDNGVRLTYNDQNTYSKYNREERNIFDEGGEIPPSSEPSLPFGNQSLTRIDLRLTSPIYGVTRRRYGNTPYAFENLLERKGQKLPNYSPVSPFIGYGKHNKQTPLESVYGIGRSGYSQNVDTVSPSEEYTLDDNQAFIKMGETIYTDFIPVWFRKKGTEKPIVFRAILSGITETTSPSWSSNKFVGNPYSFYMYDGVERALSFSIKLFATSEIILSTIWERLKILTAYSYPTISEGLTTPPIIEFRLGSMYSGKTAFIESLTYTIPDESNWETNGELGYLPKTVDVSISLKFIEQQGSEDRLYDFTISKEAAKAINEKREANAVSGDTQTGEDSGEKPPKITPNGEGKIKVVTKGIKISNPLAPKGITIPSDLQPGKVNPKEAQSGIVDKLGGKSPSQAIKETENKLGVSGPQSYQLENKALIGPKPKVIPRSSLPSFANERVIGTNGSIFTKQSGYQVYTNTTIDTYLEIDINGNVYFLGEKDEALDAALGL